MTLKNPLFVAWVLLVSIVPGWLYAYSDVSSRLDFPPVNNVPDSLELLVLKDLYQSLNGANWNTKTNWPVISNWPASATSADFDAWHGVTVSDGDIIELNLSSNNLVGVLPTSIGNLSSLTRLNLSANSLSGSIPSTIGGLESLMFLHLGYNQLSGSIPPQIGDLVELREMYLYGNPLGGSIPSEIGNLSNLVLLYANGCQLSGNVPSSIGNLTSLQYLQLDGNNLSGALPTSIGNLSSLVRLNLSANSLSGSIPSTIGGMESLVFLHLGYNQLSGSIPSQIGDLVELRELYLFGNPLGGSIPSEIGNLSNLVLLYANGCQLSGSIPSSIGNLTNLQYLQLDWNSLSGALPTSIGNLSSLLRLNLSANSLSGSIPSTIGGMESLVFLHLGYNQLSGSIPPQIGDLVELRELYLYGNPLGGSIPSEIGNLSNLVVLYANGCQLSGSVPSSIGNLTSLQYLQLDGNSLSGALPTSIGNLSSLVRLNLSANSLSGSIPSTIGGMESLVFLHLGYNQLSGSIPPQIGDLIELRELYLFGNPLGGSIPSELGNLSNLVVLFASSCQLSGIIPSTLVNLHSLTYLALQSNNLIGFPDFTSFPNKSTLSIGIDHNMIPFGDFEHYFVNGVTPFQNFSCNNQSVALPATITSDHNGSLLVTLPSPGQNPIVSWQKKKNNGSWITVNNLNEDATQRTFYKASLQLTDIGTYRVSVTSTVVTQINPSWSAEFSVSSALQPVFTPLELNGTGGGVEVTAVYGTAPYQYLWSSGETSSLISGKPAGTYSVTVTDAAGSIRTGSYGLPYRVYWSDVMGAENDNEVLTRTAPGLAWGSSGANSRNELIGSQNGWFELVTSDVTSEYALGFALDPLSMNYAAVSYGFLTSVGQMFWTESGSYGLIGPYMVGDVFRIAREAGSIIYFQNNEEVRRIPCDPSATLFLKATISLGSTPASTTSFSAPPPEPVVISVNEFAFQYRYDSRRRVTHKKVPGADWVYMVYDQRDRLVLTQDGNQRLASQWLFTKYDVLNRPVLTGIYTHSPVATQEEMQAIVNNFYGGGIPMGETSGEVHGYSNQTFPSVSDPLQYLTATYYDDYLFLESVHGGERLEFVEDELTEQQQGELVHVAGKVTGTKVKVLDGGATWLWTTNYYDEKYRVIQTISDNYKGGTDVITNVYDFVGRTITSKTRHASKDIAWTEMNGTIQTGNRLSATAGSAWGSAGAASSQWLPSGQDGWMEVTIDGPNSSWVVGFSEANEGVHMNTIDYGVWFNGPAGLSTCLNGACTYRTGAAVGDKVRIERIGSTLNFYRNGVPFHEILNASTASMLVDAALYYSGHSLSGVQASFAIQETSVTRDFEYDHAGRLETISHRLNSDLPVILSDNKYNEVGQLVDKSLHKTGSEPYLQSQDYRYNIRGWLTSVNGSELPSSGVNDDTSDLFGFDLLYEQEHSELQNEGLFNGNISAMKWSADLGFADMKERAYSYSYDGLNRITGATFKEKSTSWAQPVGSAYSESGYQYDLNGNITALTRYGKPGSPVMDQLNYDYGTGEGRSNRLLKVTDTGNDWDGFKDWTNADNDYSYDANGNMIEDKNKGITAITYNHLNLPTTITKGASASGGSISYIYDAAGRKLSQSTSMQGRQKQVDYVGEHQYQEDVLESVNHEEGRIIFSTREPVYRNSGSNLDQVISQNSTVTLLDNHNGGQTYIRAVSQDATAYNGLRVIGEDIYVQPGEKYLLRARGYTTSWYAHLVLFANGTPVGNWPRMPGFTADLECWVETIVTIPAGGQPDQLLEAGVAFQTGASGSTLYLNDFEIIKLLDTAPEYQYHLKDHLGNARITFTSKDNTEIYRATLENDTQIDEQAAFLNYSRTDFDLFDKTDDLAVYTHSQLLNGGNNSQVGLAKTFRVFTGDRVRARVWAKYLDIEGNESNLNGFATALLGAFGLPAPGIGEVGTASVALQTHGAYVAAGDHEGTEGPKGWLTILFFDDDHNLVDASFRQINDDFVQDGATKMPHDEMVVEMQATAQGYMYVFLSNEGAVEQQIYFDDFEIVFEPTRMVQVDDYYPFGLIFNSISRENSSPNPYGYNGKEMQDELDMSWLDYEARFYDPLIARWNSIDVLVEKYDDSSPYSYGLNNPIRFTDPDGMDPEDVVREANRYLGTNYEWGGKNPTGRRIGAKDRLDPNGAAIGFHTSTSKAIKQSYGTESYGTTLASSYYLFGVPSGTSFGIDCSGLAARAFNADGDKLMQDLVGGSANDQMGAFEEAEGAGTGTIHSNFALLGKGDLVFSTNKDGDAHHVGIATGDVKTGKDGNVTKFKIIEAVGSGDKVKTQWKNVSDNLRIGHTFRKTDRANAGPTRNSEDKIRLSGFVTDHQKTVK